MQREQTRKGGTKLKAHLYLHPSGFSNVADRVIIKKEPCENFSGTAVHAELDLPEGWQVVSTNFGDAIITEKDEIIEKVYPRKAQSFRFCISRLNHDLQ